jgi:acyl dehydratase
MTVSSSSGLDLTLVGQAQCTLGYADRALMDVYCDSDPAQFGSMSARFSNPVLPGQALTVSLWNDDCGARFRTTTDYGAVLDHGRWRRAVQGNSALHGS